MLRAGLGLGSLDARALGVHSLGNVCCMSMGPGAAGGPVVWQVQRPYVGGVQGVELKAACLVGGAYPFSWLQSLRIPVMVPTGCWIGAGLGPEADQLEARIPQQCWPCCLVQYSEIPNGYLHSGCKSRATSLPGSKSPTGLQNQIV